MRKSHSSSCILLGAEKAYWGIERLNSGSYSLGASWEAVCSALRVPCPVLCSGQRLERGKKQNKTVEISGSVLRQRLNKGLGFVTFSPLRWEGRHPGVSATSDSLSSELTNLLFPGPSSPPGLKFIVFQRLFLIFLSESYSLGGVVSFPLCTVVPLMWTQWGQAQFEAAVECRAWVRQVRNSVTSC